MGGLRDMTEWTVECWNGLAAYLDEERPLPDGKDNSTSFNLCYALWEGRPGASGMDAIGRPSERMVRHEHSHPMQGAHDPEHALKRLSHAGLRIEDTMDEDTGVVTFSIKSEEWTSSEPIDENEITSAPKEAQQHHAELGFSDVHKSDRDEDHPVKAFQSTHAQTRFSRPLPPFGKNDPKPMYQELPFSTIKQGAGACLSFSDEIEPQARTLYLPLAYSSFGHAAVNGDFDGDGRDDLAVYKENGGWWQIVTWTGAYAAGQFGGQGYEPITGDFDGDGRVDIGVFYKSQTEATWYLYQSTEGYGVIAARAARSGGRSDNGQ